MTFEFRYEVAMRTLADIAYSKDISDGQVQHQAKRIYEDLRADEASQQEY